MSEGGATGKGFVKGDPRINRKGRPRTFDAARELAQQIAHEEARLKAKDDGTPGDPVIVNGHRATVIEMIMRQWATSKVPALQQAFVEYAYGKPPTKTEISGPDGGPIQQRTEHHAELSAETLAAVFRILGEVNADPGTSEAGEFVAAANPPEFVHPA